MGIDSLSPQRPASGQALTEVKGIFNLDLLARHAIIAGLKDLRDNPWQLNLVFASLLDDPLTRDQYGQKVVSKAIDWFLATNIPVIMDYNLTSSPAMPLITVGILDGKEAEATLGDVHYVPSQNMPAEWEPLTGKFAAAYDPATGLVTPAITITANDKMVLVDGAGIKHPILEVVVTNTQQLLRIEPGLVTDFSNCVIQWSTTKMSAQLGSLNFQETCRFGAHIKGETEHLLWLWNIIVYLVLRYKQTLFEARGFERTTLSFTQITPNRSLSADGELFWSRFATVTGYTKYYFAQGTSERIASASFNTPSEITGEGLKFSQVGRTSVQFKAPEDQEDPSWMASDGIGVAIIKDEDETP